LGFKSGLGDNAYDVSFALQVFCITITDHRRLSTLTMKRTLLIGGVFLFSIATPQTAFADVGTPLLWAGLLHMVIGNAVIGVVEGLVLAKLFSLAKIRTVIVMIVANYFSAWVGELFLGSLIVNHLHIDLNNGWRWFWIMVLFTYWITLALEWPFVAFCLRGSVNWFRKSIKGNLIIQTLSYAVLFGWYWMASETSLYTRMHVVSPREVSLPESVLMYFISEHDGDVYVRDLSGRENRHVFELQSTNEYDVLVFQSSASQTDTWDLFARIGQRDPRLVEIEKGFSDAAVAHRPNPQFREYEIPRLGNADKNEWSFGWWGDEELYGTNAVKRKEVFFSYETPFAQWTVRSATQLPGDKVLFQLGENQICVFDPESKKVALLAHGRSPVAVIRQNTNDRDGRNNRQTY
jgi:hypothetical protein